MLEISTGPREVTAELIRSQKTREGKASDILVFSTAGVCQERFANEQFKWYCSVWVQSKAAELSHE